MNKDKNNKSNITSKYVKFGEYRFSIYPMPFFSYIQSYWITKQLKYVILLTFFIIFYYIYKIKVNIERQKPLKIDSINVSEESLILKNLVDLGFKETDEDSTNKRNHIKKMMKESWQMYYNYALGYNEVDPINKVGYNSAEIHKDLRGITVVDSLDTLYIMGLYNEYQQAKKWVNNNLTFKDGMKINFFESNIRVLGGLLSAYYLTHDDIYLQKATEYGNKVIPNFQNVFPSNTVVLSTLTDKSAVSLAQIGTLHLEFAALSKLTGDDRFVQDVKNIHLKLKEIFDKKDSSLHTVFSYKNFTELQSPISIGADGDSFYEYLLKSYIQDKSYKLGFDFFVKAIERIEKNLLQKNTNFTYFITNNNHIEHLSCFTGGMYALASKYRTTSLQNSLIQTAESLVDTCYQSCINTITGLCPEAFSTDIKPINSAYYLRPELIESIFYMFRITGDIKYRNMGWKLINNIYRYTRAPDGGYSSVRYVDTQSPMLIGKQESFFMAETLKYAYLLFSDPDFISLDEFVFNTEAHPLGIFN